MSNTQVGNVYQQIISDVVESSRVDFEEGGVEEQVLEELRQVRPLFSVHQERCCRISRPFLFHVHFLPSLILLEIFVAWPYSFC